MGFFAGLKLFLAAPEQAFSADNRRFIWLPALVSLLIVGAGLWFALSYVDELTAYFNSFSWWPEFLDYIVEPLLYLLSVLMGAWLFGFIAVVLGSPFYSALNAHLDPVPDAKEVAWYQQIWPTLKRELVKAKYVVPRLLGLFIVGFIPGLNLLAPVLWLLYGGWLMAVQFSDLSFENRNLSFDETLATLRGYRTMTIGVGAGLTLAMSIPLLNFIVGPIGVVATSHLVRKLRSA